MRKIHRVWPLGFLGFLGIRGLVGLYDGDWLEALWIVWLAFFAYFIPLKEMAEGPAAPEPKKRTRTRKAGAEESPTEQ
jgi:hypothetical protein